MLVLTRKLGESIAIDDHIKIMVVQIKGKQVRLGIQAPAETKIHRQEVYETIQTSNREASTSTPQSISQIADLARRDTATPDTKKS
jgi:carbon storage regulator